MNTAVAAALRKARDIQARPSISSDSPSRRDVTFVVNGVTHSMDELLRGGIVDVGDVDIDHLRRATPNLQLPKRTYSVDSAGNIVYQNNKGNSKIIERPGYISTDHVLARDLDRELVVVLRGEKDTFTTEMYAIKHLRNLILASFADDEKVARLREMSERVAGFMQTIKNGHEGKGPVLDLEAKSKVLYDEITRVLSFSDLDHHVIRALSWEWKSRVEYRSHPISCRVWILGACIFPLMGNQKKTQK